MGGGAPGTGGGGGAFCSQPAALACRSVSLMSVTASSEGSVGGKQAKNKDEAERMGSALKGLTQSGRTKDS